MVGGKRSDVDPISDGTDGESIPQSSLCQVSPHMFATCTHKHTHMAYDKLGVSFHGAFRNGLQLIPHHTSTLASYLTPNLPLSFLQLALKAGVFYDQISNVTIWGNHSTTQVGSSSTNMGEESLINPVAQEASSVCRLLSRFQLCPPCKY